MRRAILVLAVLAAVATPAGMAGPPRHAVESGHAQARAASLLGASGCARVAPHQWRCPDPAPKSGHASVPPGGGGLPLCNAAHGGWVAYVNGQRVTCHWSSTWNAWLWS